MDMLKQSIGIAMLCIAGQAYSADIVVTTTEDISSANDKQCSLREAIEYINLGLPEAGYNGCGGKSSTSTILLEKKAVYKLSNHINIKADLSIRTSYTTDVNDKDVPGLNNATIQMLGTDNIFRIDDSKKTLATVSLREITLQGCGASQCAEQGGLIYNNEYLTLEYTRLYNGSAAQGGAIYNMGQPEAETAASIVEIKSSLIENNKALAGAILYTHAPEFRISNSVFRENNTTQTGSSNIYSASRLEVNKITEFPQARAWVNSSTFLKNQGHIINLRDGIGLNNLTIVGNQAGILFDAPLGKGYLANSIILGNPYPGGQQANCTFAENDQSILQNNLVSQECGLGATHYPNEYWSGTQLIAGETLQGACKSMSQDPNSLLCPYSQPKDTFLGYFRPRILLSYNSLADSPIVNKGKNSFNPDIKIVGCEAADQRKQVRDSNNIFCDRGAIEIIVPTTVSLVGEDIRTGGQAKMSVADLLGDSDLIPKEQCNAILGPHPSGEAWQAGCIQVVQTVTQSKGTLKIDEEGNLVYTPNGGWHGTDIFKIRLVTTSTRFNQNIPYMEINVQVRQEPENHMESDKIKTSGGALGMFSLFTLLALVGLRRYTK